MRATALSIVVAVVALEHLWFMALESFLWTRPIGLRTFGNTPERARLSAALAANQGVYNGFLAAGLVWGLLDDQYGVQVFFLACVILAGVYGAITVNRRILLVQALPAAVALLFVVLAH